MLVRFFFVAFLSIFALNQPSLAQTDASSKVVEEAEIRRALDDVVQEQPALAPDVKKTLDTLDKPQERTRALSRAELRQRRIVNGIPVRGYPHVGALLFGDGPNSARVICTGSLVGCDKFLTAAHCVEKPNKEKYFIFFQELGFFKVAGIEPHPDYKSAPLNDLAMITLQRPVEGIAPIGINTALKEPARGDIATLVGFGRTGGGRYDYGIKRDGSVKKGVCPSDFKDKKVLCWSFVADFVSKTSPQNTCDADSGGGVFMKDNDETGRLVLKIFAVVSQGSTPSCMRDDVSYNADVYQYKTWFEKYSGTLSTNMCGSSLPTEKEFEPKATVFHLYNADKRLTDGKIEPKKDKDSVQWLIPEGTRVLRIAMNGEDDGSNEFHLTAGPSTLAASPPPCTHRGPGQFAFCEIPSPATGDWTFTVFRARGSGDVQLTATFLR